MLMPMIYIRFQCCQFQMKKVMAGEGRQWLVSCIRDFPWGVTGVIIYFYHKTSCHFQNKYQIASTVEKLKTFMVVKQGKGDTFRINTPPPYIPLCFLFSSDWSGRKISYFLLLEGKEDLRFSWKRKWDYIFFLKAIWESYKEIEQIKRQVASIGNWQRFLVCLYLVWLSDLFFYNKALLCTYQF